MKLNFEKDIQKQRTNHGAKVEELRREANEVSIYFFFFFCFSN
jgi:hypothetical protein